MPVRPAWSNCPRLGCRSTGCPAASISSRISLLGGRRSLGGARLMISARTPLAGGRQPATDASPLDASPSAGRPRASERPIQSAMFPVKHRGARGARRQVGRRPLRREHNSPRRAQHGCTTAVVDSLVSSGPSWCEWPSSIASQHPHGRPAQHCSVPSAGVRPAFCWEECHGARPLGSGTSGASSAARSAVYRGT